MINFPKKLEPQFELKKTAKKTKIKKKISDKVVIEEMVKIIKKSRLIKEEEDKEKCLYL